MFANLNLFQLADSLACYWFTQTTDAMAYIHNDVKMAHRDIKIDNVSFLKIN